MTSENFLLNVNVPNQAPTISEIANQTTAEDTATAAISFTVGDRLTPAASLVVSGTSSNTTLVPNQNIVLAGTGADRTVRITPALNQFGTSTVTLTVQDGDGLTATESFQLTVQAVNDAPVNTVPASQAMNENTTLVFSTANGNAIRISDVDAGGNDISLKLAVGNGSLNLATTAGLTLVAGNGADSVRLTGPLTAVNAALNGLTYTPTTNFAGSVVLSIATDDLGNTGLGGPKIDNDNVNISITDVNRPPTITSSDSIAVLENTTFVGKVSATDPDADPITFSISGGADQAAFAINSITGDLSFGSPKDFENPSDANGDNIYLVEVRPATVIRAARPRRSIRVEVRNDAIETAPTVTIVDVSPSPRAASVGDITIRFSEAVTGFNLADLTLRRSTDSTVSLLPGAATLTTTDNITWKLGNLNTLTADSGIYELKVWSAAGSGSKTSPAPRWCRGRHRS